MTLRRARQLHAEGKLEEALGAYAEAVRLEPRDTEALCDFGMALNDAGRFAEAVAQFEKALELRPDFTDARYNLGNAFAGLGQIDEAIECYRKVLVRAPHSADTHSNLGVVLQERGDLDAALAAYERALELHPEHAEALNNLAALLEERGRRRDAMALYRRALQADPASARAAYNLGLAHLREFEFEPGWRYCEARFHTKPPVTSPRPFRVPEFSGADFGRGQRIAVWREQGVGDQVLYSTLLTELEARAERFVAEIDARLIPAYQRAHPGWQLVPPEQSVAAFADCDRHIALGSLARFLRPTKASFARQPEALLAADPERAVRYRARLAADGARVIGISWRSFQSVRGYVRQKKSAPLAMFMALSRRLRLLDLQYGDTRAERDAFAAAGGRLERVQELDLFGDLEGVLAAIAACDAVVTTSNVTAHFAGALGKPTWLIHPGSDAPFFYWVPGDDGRCLWYPAVRIVNGDDWESAMARVPV
ncbi:MAG TPA: tetratricopeptide repeat-containing glycosyltransferase family protein [Burkholderiales bacterium]